MIISLIALATALGGAADTLRFHQGVDYRIEARVEEGNDVLHGRARLRYSNRSPVALDTIWFHQHLNAFRPNSAWARRELQFGNRRFQQLGPQEHAFERLTRVEVGGRAVVPVYPGAPDSTVVGIPLPAAVRPGQTVEVRLDWTARLSTVPRRQGRRGRQFDFAQWYPRVAVFDAGGWQVQPLLPQGEFYGEFGSYDVTLDVASDQVIGSTGVPVEGDPGWTRNARTRGAPAYQRDFYPRRPAEALGLLSGSAQNGRKRVRWRAEQVHHFAWSMDPAYIYEAGEAPRTGAPGASGTIPIHVLYQPGDTAWDEGVAVQRTARTLTWLQQMLGPYHWPQITNLHRIESGGTEFPMLVMNGSASEGLIAHELAHQYVHGMLANNEFASGWLDEGFASFIDLWYLEERGVPNLWARDMEGIRGYERAGRSLPIARHATEFPDMNTYNAMTYTKTSLVLRMLRDMVGADTMRAILREYHRRYALKHVTETDFRSVAEDVSGQELDWFFDQWLHTTKTLDYGIGSARVARLPDGRWQTRVSVSRVGEAWMPVALQVGETTRVLTSRDPVQEVEVVTTTRPAEVVLDPAEILIDLDTSNNRARL
ncbi:MAG: M1 family metallopeptidase [Gemmatimonadetes bacterium]|nr:M1 family metallopeptidase [Gemmatimonadota bacterium]